MSQFIYLEKCTSTNDEILRFLNGEFRNFLAVCTFNQTNGRGQYGNSWESSENLNIAFSMAIKDESVKTSFSLFNYYTVTIIREFIANMTNCEVKIKWPNDIIIREKKICGMLMERRKHNGIGFFILGVGINMLQNDFQGLPKAGSVYTQTGQKFNLMNFSEKLHQFLSEKLFFKISDKEILEKYNAELFRKNKISVFSKNNLRQNGIIQRADAEGFLWVDLERDGLQKFYNKEIEMLY